MTNFVPLHTEIRDGLGEEFWKLNWDGVREALARVRTFLQIVEAVQGGD